MVQIDGRYEGQLRCRVEHEPSGNTLDTDAPKDNEGRGESFSPTDLVATALGSCMVTIMGIYAKRHDLDLEGTRFRVQKSMNADPRRIGKLEVEILVPHDPGEKHRAALERAALSCPVHRSLHPDIEIPFTLSFGEG